MRIVRKVSNPKPTKRPVQKRSKSENGQTTPSLVNLSLAFRDEIGGSHVNLMNSKTPADIYKVIADKTIWKLKTYVQKRNSCENVQEEITESDLAQWWLDFGITRKVTKRNCMTFPYGSKQRGFSDQILEDHLRPLSQNETVAKWDTLLQIRTVRKCSTLSKNETVAKFLTLRQNETVAILRTQNKNGQRPKLGKAFTTPKEHPPLSLSTDTLSTRHTSLEYPA